MSNVEAISGATGDELKSLEDKAKEMGEQTSKSAKESADALGYMALAGWDTQQMLEGLEPVLRASEAGNIDLATCSDLVTNSMSSLSLQVGDLGKYLDIATKTQNSASTNLQQMLEAYNEVGGTFSNLNVSLEEGATWLGVLANRSLKGSEAGNSLNSLLVNLTGGSSTAANAMQELGVSAWDANGNFKGIEETLRTLQGALANCTQEQKTNFESAIGGKTQLTTLQKMLSGLGAEYGSLKQEITNCDGALIETAETMQNNTQGNITRFKSKLEGVANSIGEILLPTINKFLDKVTVVLNWFGNLDDKTKKIIVTIGGVAAAIGPALLVAGKVAFSINSIVEATSKLSNVFGGAKLTTMFNPWVLGATAAIGVGILIYKNWDKIKEMAGKLKDYLSEKFNAIKETVTKVFDNVKNSVKEKFNTVKDTISNAMSTAGKYVAEKLSHMKSAYEENGGGIKGIVASTMEGIKQYYSVGYDAINNLTGGKLEKVVNVISEKFNTVKEYMSNIMSAIGDKVSEKFEIVKNKISNIMETIEDTVRRAINKVKDLFNFNWSLPKIKLPHFEITGKFNLNPPEVPHLGVDWYSMGAIFTKPTILGGIGVGDANNGRGSNAEAVVPLNSMYNNITEIMRRELSNSSQTLSSQALEEFKKITSTPVQTQPININITLQSDVNMDGRKVGDMVTNRIIDNITRQQKTRNIARHSVRVSVK